MFQKIKNIVVGLLLINSLACAQSGGGSPQSAPLPTSQNIASSDGSIDQAQVTYNGSNVFSPAALSIKVMKQVEREETYQDTCYQQVPYQDQECHTEYHQRQECHYQQQCHNNQVCHNEQHCENKPECHNEQECHLQNHCETHQVCQKPQGCHNEQTCHQENVCQNHQVCGNHEVCFNKPECHNEQVCHNDQICQTINEPYQDCQIVTRYRNEVYVCTKTRTVTETVLDYQETADVQFDFSAIPQQQGIGDQFIAELSASGLRAITGDHTGLYLYRFDIQKQTQNIDAHTRHTTAVIKVAAQDAGAIGRFVRISNLRRFTPDLMAFDFAPAIDASGATLGRQQFTGMILSNGQVLMAKRILNSGEYQVASGLNGLSTLTVDLRQLDVQDTGGQRQIAVSLGIKLDNCGSIAPASFDDFSSQQTTVVPR